MGSCDLYTTKAAGADKKLYKNIEQSLESQYESVLRLSASLSPPKAESAAASLNLSRSSPFGSLSQTSSRRTFAYLIATLNASHPDYDFSGLLRPSDFRREKRLKKVMNTLDTTLYNLRPRTDGVSAKASARSSSAPPTPGGSHVWGPRMWSLIDKEMGLKECAIYSYVPEEDYEGEDGGLWSLNYFFFNKARKRVCYIHLRGYSALSGVSAMPTPVKTPRRKRSADDDWTPDPGAGKRAKYWLGDREDLEISSLWDAEDEDDTVYPALQPESSILTDESALLEDDSEIGSSSPSRRFSNRRSSTADSVFIISADEGEPSRFRSPNKSAVRGVSEEIVETMEI